jgi:type III pantothenate kinase
MKLDLLLVDFGNTRVKWATARARSPLSTAGDYPSAKVTASWIRTFARKYVRHHLVLASVVPKWIPVFEDAFAGHATVVSGRSPIPGLTFRYPKPAELGADRIAAAVAVQALRHFPAIIVACGTATAFTVLDAKGWLCGGAIAPGLQAQLNALIGATAQLPATELRMPRSALAKSTRDAINAGVLIGFQGGVKEIVRRLSETFPRGTKPHIVLTGGNAKLMAKALGPQTKLCPLLVFEGLRIIGSRHWQAGDE